MSNPAVKNILPFALLGGIIALGALPWYMQVLPGSSILHYQGPWIYPSHWGDSVWLQSLFIALPLGGFAVWKAPDYRLKALGVTLILCGLLVPWLSYDETIINIFYRSGYLMGVVFYPLMAWLVARHWLPDFSASFKVRPSVVVGAAGPVVAGLLLAGAVFQFHNQAGYSDMATPATVNALRVAGSEKGIATNSFTLSLWVAALNRVHSPFAFTAPPPEAYVDDDAWLRCLLNWVEGCDPARAAQKLGVGWLLIDERFPGYNNRAPGNYLAPPDQWERTAEAAWLELAYSEGTTRLWRVVPSRESALIK